jgi:hypothetical protein
MPLGAYEDIMQWHFNAIRRNRHVTYVGNDCPISREKLLKKLFKRYNMEGFVNCSCQITLPSSGAKVKIMTNSMEWCLQSLLTDPSIADDDYLFHNNDPFCPPPEESLVVGDINTGQAYYESYKKYIKIPGKQVLLPVIFYIDGTATAQFSDLPVTALKFTLGIFNRKARDRPQMWRILGYVPNFSKEKSLGRRQFYNSGHIESANLGLSMSQNEGNIGDNDVVPAQDLHTILAKILEPYIHTSKKCFMGYCPDLWQFCPLLCPICPQFFIFAANWWHTYNFYASTNVFGFILGQITCMFAHQNGLNRAYRANQFSHP